MNSKTFKQTLAAASVALVLAACGSTAPKISESDILSAERNGTLLSLYTQIRDGKGAGAKLKPADKSAYLQKIGTRLANQTSQAVNAMLNESRLESSQVPLSTLQQLQRDAQKVQPWDGNVHSNLVNSINNELNLTKNAIQVKQSVYDAIDSQEIGKKIDLIQQMKILSGDANAERFVELREQVLSDNYDRVDQFVMNKQFDQAIGQLKKIAEVAPNYKDVSTKLAEIEKTALQDTFIGYVSDGETLKAQELLQVIAKGKYFNEQKAVIMPAAIDLANYYLAMGVEATGEENLVDAYNMFTKARGVKTLFGLQGQEVTEESDFIDFVYALYEEAYNKKVYGLSLGYLSVIEQLRPQFPELETYKRLVTDNVMNQAVKRVTTTAFASDDNNKALGRSISSKITQYVFDTLPQDVRVVERDQLNAVLREQEISALQQGTGVQLDSADLLIQGTVLESNVETTENNSSKKQRVVTERKKVSNPAYAQWLALSSSKRAKTPEPDKHLIKEIKEDVSIAVTYVRKVAILSISYRLVDAQSSRVLFADAVTDKKKVADETTEGVQLGEFNSPFKMAELPSDSELTSDLTVLLAERIGEKVVELLKDPEVGYTTEGKRLFDERNYVDATEQVARALVMVESKGKDNKELLQLVRQYSMAARLEN